MIPLTLLLGNYKERIRGRSVIPQITEVNFSFGTYQIQILDPDCDESFWCFIQLASDLEIKDSFCECGSGDEDICFHLLTALHCIFEDHQKPLHLRFERSFWRQMCLCLGRRCHFSDEYLNLKKETQEAFWKEGAGTLFFRAKTHKAWDYLCSLFENRERETEENSIKFSNLSSEDIQLWRKGNPKEFLKFELSCWADFAKWLFLLDLGHTSHVTYDYDSMTIPRKLVVEFSQIVLHFSFSQEDLELLIPTLSSLKGPLEVFQGKEEVVASMHYDPLQKTMLIRQKENYEIPFQEKPIIIGPWVYVSFRGFYFNEEHPLLHQEELKGMDIGFLLNAYPSLVRKHLGSLVIDEKIRKVNYQLVFDRNWSLHLNPYLFRLGDLQDPLAVSFVGWVYLPPKGFFKVLDLIDDDCHKVIARDDVGVFVSHFQNWLSDKKGFETHLTKIEASLSFEVNLEHDLVFNTHIDLDMEGQSYVDFGDWVYIEGQGFYSKSEAHVDWPLRSLKKIPKESVAQFIDHHHQQLETVKGFFSTSCPIVNTIVDIYYRDHAIHFCPFKEYFPGYQNKCIHYSSYVYVAGEGFSRLPYHLSLPDRYQEAVIIHKQEQIEEFLHTHLPLIEKKIRHIDSPLCIPRQFSLECTDYHYDEKSHKNILTLFFVTDYGRIPLKEMVNAAQNAQRYLFSPAGLIDLSDPRYYWLHTIKKGDCHLDGNQCCLSTIQLLHLMAQQSLQVSSPYEEVVQRLENIAEQKSSEEFSIEGLQSHLRPYQMIGVHWLWFLYCHQLSGLLCDDMGLGKTHQAMALVASIKNRFKNSEKKPLFLVVCPTSVIYHWEEKLKEFLPLLKVYTFHGTYRSLEGFYRDGDVLLTSYGVSRVEHEELEGIYFDLAIFDEIQIAKNHQSQVHHTLKKMRAHMKLGLSGTPLENHVREVKSLFDIVLPSYMPSESVFREEFIIPIEKEQDHVAKKRLKELMKPFVLRRKKQDVLLELPEKIEEIAHCELSNVQKQIYGQLMSSVTPQLLEELKTQQAIPFVHIFALLNKLKQICNHPALFYESPEDYQKYPSGKWDLFVELLDQALESNEKVVVFTQYLKMLDIFELHLKKKGIHYALIKGSTSKRKEQLQKFQEDDTCSVFLGSLAAVGLGIDLTAACVVIHYDRWWNPARESQATDRVYRMGQKRGVHVFKLVTKDSIEERIDEIITNKMRLIEDVVGVDEHHVLKTFSREQLISLLSDLHS